eukprot:scaffold1798_cov118-Isochrysis_galbana.AAC.1
MRERVGQVWDHPSLYVGGGLLRSWGDPGTRTILRGSRIARGGVEPVACVRYAGRRSCTRASRSV